MAREGLESLSANVCGSAPEQLQPCTLQPRQCRPHDVPTATVLFRIVCHNSQPTDMRPSIDRRARRNPFCQNTLPNSPKAPTSQARSCFHENSDVMVREFCRMLSNHAGTHCAEPSNRISREGCPDAPIGAYQNQISLGVDEKRDQPGSAGGSHRKSDSPLAHVGAERTSGSDSARGTSPLLIV